MIKVFKGEKKGEWDKVIEDLRDKGDIFYTENYVKLYSKLWNGEVLNLLYQKDNSKILSTFIKRKIENSDFFDIVTPYGCGGLLIETDLIENSSKIFLLEEFYKKAREIFSQEGIVSEFNRLHPLLTSLNLFPSFLKVHHVTLSVFIDLEKEVKEIEKKFRKGTKHILKRALKEKIEVKISKDEKDIEIFHRIYTETMKRREASEFYFFPLWFIKEFFKNFEHSYVFIAYYKGIEVAASLFLGYNKFFHYYLSGSDFNYKKLGATHLIIYEAIKFAKEKGFKIMHLGGGMKGKDSLFLFKSGFSDWHLPYYVYGVIHNQEIYDKLVEERKKKGPLKEDFYFPLYRAPLK